MTRKLNYTRKTPPQCFLVRLVVDILQTCRKCSTTIYSCFCELVLLGCTFVHHLCKSVTLVKRLSMQKQVWIRIPSCLNVKR